VEHARYDSGRKHRRDELTNDIVEITQTIEKLEPQVYEDEASCGPGAESVNRSRLMQLRRELERKTELLNNLGRFRSSRRISRSIRASPGGGFATSLDSEFGRVRPIIQRLPVAGLGRCRSDSFHPPSETSVVRGRGRQIAGQAVPCNCEVCRSLHVGMPTQSVDASPGPSNVTEQELKIAPARMVCVPTEWCVHPSE
jgi:hypothetical protein